MSLNWLPLFLFTLLTLAGALETRAADPGTVTGKVTGPNGTTALANIQVRGYLWDDEEEEWSDGGVPVVTNASGNYSLSLPPGEYIVGFRDPAGNFAEEYHDNEWHLWYADRFQVVSGQTVSGKNASLANAARISGTVTSTAGGPAAGVEVRSYMWDDVDEYWASGPATTTAANGTYNLGGLTPGTHRIRFLHPTGAYFTSFHGGVTDVDDATSVPATAGNTVSGINGSVAPAGRISGTVTGTGGAPLSGIYVTVYQWDEDEEYWDWIEESETLANGTYFVGKLFSGVYRVEFYDGDRLYDTEYYNNAANIDLAANVSVTVGSITGGINGSLSERGKISGTVTGPNGVTPVAGVQVTAYVYDDWEGSWDSYRSVVSAANGTYLLAGLPAGPVRLRFFDPTQLHFTEFYDNVATVYQAQNITVANGTTVTGINASLAKAGSISGTVTGPNGTTPLDWVVAEVYQWDPVWLEWNWIADAQTRGGAYTVGGLTTGTYRVYFYDSDGLHLSECYNNAPDLDSATDIQVTTGSNTGGINASLVERGKISGKVTAANGVTPLAGIRVTYYRYSEIYEEWDYYDDVTTAADGTYVLTGLPTGIVRLQFYDPSGIYLTEYHSNAASVETGTDIVVSPGTTVSGVNASLDKSGSISGLVTGPNGTTPLTDIEVSVYRWNPGWEDWDWEASAHTENGLYTVRGLPTGSYRVQFMDDNGIHATECYNNAPDLDSATPVAVTVGVDTPGINASLATRGKISGKVTGPNGVTPLAGIEVEVFVYDSNDEYWYSTDRSVDTAADGTYEIAGLPNGVVRIRFRDPEQVHVQEFYQDVATVEQGTDITVSTGVTVTGINASLAIAGSISGTVTGPNGVTPLGDVTVYAYRWDPTWEAWQWVHATSTLSNGTYHLRGLSTGSYRVRFDDDNYGHLTEYYNNAATLQLATDVSVSLGNVTAGINASLQLGGTISGTVTGIDSVPLYEARVSLYVWNAGDEEWERISNAYTGEEGTYRFRTLEPGVYRVGFSDYDEVYVSEFYNAAATVESAADIVIAIGSSVTGIDASMVPKGRVSGKVTGPDGTTPLKEIYVTAYQYDASEEYWDLISVDYTGGNGNYVISGLNPGAVRIRFSDSAGLFLTEYYNNASSFDLAQDVAVSNGTLVSGVNASLGSAGRITGTVTGPDGLPLEDVEVGVYRWDASMSDWDQITYTWTREDGTYRLGGLLPGVYRIGFVDEGSSDHVGQFYNNVSDIHVATDITVTGGSVRTGVDASLALKPRIIGKVTGPYGVTPLADAQVRIYRYDEWDEWWYSEGTAYTRPDGSYSLAVSSPGAVRIRFQDQEGNFTEYYNNSPDIESAQDVIVPASGDVLGINASLGAAEPVAPAVLGFRKTGTGTWELEFSGGQGSLYQLQDSTDLRTWRDVGTPVSGASGVNILPLSTDGPKRFWRVRSAP